MKKTLALLLSVLMILSSFGFGTIVFAEEATATEAIEIKDADSFLKIGKDDAYPLSGNYKLVNDITITSTNYTPVGSYAAPFTGTFDGNDKTVTVDLTYTNATATNTVDGCAYVGLFGCIKEATVTKLNVSGKMTVNTVCGYIGGIIGCAYGNTTVSYCESDVDMTITFNDDKDHPSFIGGVIGVFNQTKGDDVTASNTPTITYCVNKGDINVTSNANANKSTSNEYNFKSAGSYGGIVGATGYAGNYAVRLTVSHCINYGDIHVTQGNQNIGGVFGLTVAGAVGTAETYGRADITWCANYGNISRDKYVGDRIAAIAGYLFSGNVSYCFNAGVLDEGVLISDETKTRSVVFVGWYGNHGKTSYVDHCFSTTHLDSFLECYSRMDLTKTTDNYVLSDTADSTGANLLSVSSTTGMADIVKATYMAVDSEMKAKIAIAGIGDLANVYFDYNKPVGTKTLGYQVTDVDSAKGTYNIRFVSLVDSLNYGKIGYDITAAYGENQEKTFYVECKSVYTKLTDSVSGTEAAYAVTGDYYIMALAITGVPASAGTITFEVVPYAYVDGVKTCGEAVTIEYTPAQ